MWLKIACCAGTLEGQTSLPQHPWQHSQSVFLEVLQIDDVCFSQLLERAPLCATDVLQMIDN